MPHACPQMGQLSDYGFRLVEEEERESADCWVINSCTVKGPSQDAMSTLIKRGKVGLCGARIWMGMPLGI